MSIFSIKYPIPFQVLPKDSLIIILRGKIIATIPIKEAFSFNEIRLEETKEAMIVSFMKVEV